MAIPDYIALSVIAVWIVLAVLYLVRHRGRGCCGNSGTSCSGNCASCSGNCASCSGKCASAGATHPAPEKRRHKKPRRK